ncbi:TonB-dependent receptor plug domain-containing protein [Porticoccus sp. GXU_MW_L64]
MIIIDKKHRVKNLVLGVASVCALSLAPLAQAETDKFNIDIESQNIGSALMALSQSSGVQIVISKEMGEGTRLSQVKGNYTVAEALSIMLEGTKLGYKFISDSSVVIKPEDQTGEAEEKNRTEEADEEVVVTGSRIARNASELAANVITLDIDTLRNSGEATLEGALRRLPQNVFSASEVGSTLLGNSFNGALNITGGSNINLRGLGSESTLVLIDGRRIGKSGVFGGASDISGIPLQSVARVEVLLDGASAIYGSDAVGGVINIILKKDYEGATARYEYGRPEASGFEEHVLTLSGSTGWGSGRLSVDFERFQRSNLDGGERPEAVRDITFWRTGLVSDFNNPVFFRYNGENFLPSQLPVPTTDPGVEAVQFFVLPDGQGSTVPLSSITNIRTEATLNDTSPEASEGISLIPAQQRNNLQLRLEQELSEKINFGANLYYSDRNTYSARGGFTANVPTNPLTNGSGSPFESAHRIRFRLPGFADQHNETEQTVTRWSLYVDGELGNSWQWETSIGQSRDKIDSLHVNQSVNFSGNPATAAAAVPTGLNLYTGDILADNSPEVLSRLIAPPATTVSVNKESTADFRANGALFELPGGSVNIAIGGEWRQETLESRTESAVSDLAVFNLSVPVSDFDTADLDAPVSSIQRAGYAEVLVPLVSSDNAFVGMQQLTLTGAGRYDSYSNLGSDSTWSLGMVWRPVEQISFKLRRSTSFVAPTPREKLIPRQQVDFSAIFPGGLPLRIRDAAGNTVGFDFQSLLVFGGNPDLEAENATTSTAIVEITPEVLPGLRLSASWHETEYINRISANPQPRLLAGVDYVAENPALSRDENGLLVIDSRAINSALLYQSGVDYQLYYSRDTEFGEFYASTNVAVTSNFERIRNAGEPRVSELERSTVSRVIPTRRYSADFGWNNRGMSIAVTANTTSKTYRSVSPYLRITDTPLNVNLSMSYNMDEGDLFSTPEWLSGTSVSFRILNLLDDITENRVVDPDTGNPVTNERFYNLAFSDPRGRMLYFGLTKQF